jgi:hypothetical protein
MRMLSSRIYFVAHWLKISKTSFGNCFSSKCCGRGRILPLCKGVGLMLRLPAGTDRRVHKRMTYSEARIRIGVYWSLAWALRIGTFLILLTVFARGVYGRSAELGCGRLCVSIHDSVHLTKNAHRDIKPPIRDGRARSESP